MISRRGVLRAGFGRHAVLGCYRVGGYLELGFLAWRIQHFPSTGANGASNSADCYRASRYRFHRGPLLQEITWNEARDYISRMFDNRWRPGVYKLVSVRSFSVCAYLSRLAETVVVAAATIKLTHYQVFQ